MKKLHFALYLIIMAFSILLIAKQNKKIYYSFNQTNSLKKIMNDNNFNDYNTLWEKVQEFENNGLPQSADSIVMQIYERAIKENNSSQQIKASIYTNKYKVQREEEGGFKAITNIENEIKKLNFPEKNILQNYLASFYWQYYTNNQYTINQRSNTSNFNNPDFRLWSSNDFILKITNLFDHSLQNAEQLYNINIGNYNDLINQGNTEGRIRKPTLYHVLANDALNFYTNENAYLTQPSYQFTINEKIYFSDVASFIRLKTNSKDSINYKLKAIQIYQDILKNDLAKQNEKALIFTDVNRLNFIRENYTGENKETLYENAIQKLYNENQNNENKFYLAYNYAQFLSQKNYDKTLNDKNKFSIAEAIAILEKIKKDPTTGFYKNECSILLCQLYQGNLNVKTAEVNEPEKPILAQVSYQNITNLEMFFYKLNPEQTWQWIKLKYSNENRIQNRLDFLKKLKIDRTQNQILPNENDYRSHITNIKLPSLSPGKYIIVLKAKNQYNSQHFEEIIEMYASNLAILSRNQKGDLETLFTHRTTGEPIRNAVANKYIASYMQDKNYYNQIVFSSPEKVKTDNNGFVITKNSAVSDNQMHLFMINKEDDFFINENFLQTFKHYEQQYNNQYTSSVLFTDRSIYRPLQTIYFKGICFDVTNNKSKLKTSFKDVIKLYDANYQEIKKIELTTNDYGSYAGKFELPDGLMTGNYTIRSSFGQVSFSVEEYKRPTFEVKYDTLKGSFRLNDMVKIKGIAKTYAGSNITDAKVKYRITRKAQFPYWYCYYWWLPYPQQNTMEIDNGTIYTNEKGEFEITFKALADETIDKKTKPIFNFEINADITDLNGETRSATQYVNVGYVALVVDAQVVPILKKSKIDTLIINTKNVNGVFEPAKGKISIIKLESPNPKLREPIANWSKPDVFTMSEAEFKTNFPLDVYKDENEYQNWEKRETVLEKFFDTQKSKKIACDFVSTAPTGKYLINIETKDAFDEPITYTHYVDLYDDVSNIADKQSPLMLQLSKTSIDINEKTDMCYESKFENAWVLFEYSSGNNLIERTWVQPYGKKKCKTFTASAIDLNKKFTISTLCINNSRVYQQEMGYNIDEKPKTLQMKMSVFRNKLYPGQEETWKLKISGNDAEQVSAELLASMYDASLDAIKPHDWSNLYFPNNNHDILNYTSRLTHAFTSHGFNTSFSLSEYSYENNCGQNSSFLEFDSFNHFGFYLDNYTNRYYYRNEGRLLSKNEAPMMMMMDESSSTNKNVLETQSIQATSVVGGNSKDVSNRKDADKAYTEENKAGNSNKQGNNSIAVQIRKNFNETAFFLPQLETNPLGEVEIKFTLPDALTQWKFMALAHTKDMRVAKITENITASKDLMVFPNMPRFLREDDEIVLQTKISNISDKSLNGTVQLELLDINKDKSIAELFTANNLLQNFTVEKGKNTFASWKIKIPKDIGVVRYRITARTNTFSDGEENILPILSNEMLVTESLPLSVNKGITKGFVFNKLKENNPNFRTHSLTLEYTSNPAWYAIQALPYLMEYPYECSEQTFSRLYANAIASHIANSNPKIKSVFEQWENTPALQSNLEKNQELKQLLLQQTPWVLEAKDESERKRRIGILFNIGKMKKEFTKAENTLFDMQLQNGGFPWFKGYPWDDRFITQHIVCGFGKLDKLGVKDLRKKGKTAQMINKALQYIDGKMYNDYLELKKYGQDESYTSSFISHYFYTRSFYDKSYPINDQYKIAYDYFYTRLQKHWLQLDKYSQGMAAIALYRNGDSNTANKIIQSLKQNMYSSEEMGLYFVKETGYYWYQAPIETQAMMIEAFDEIANDQENIDKMKTWLLKQKQTQDWKTTKATVEACYALMLRGIDYLSENSLPDINIGGEKLQIDKRETEAGTGYFKKRWEKQDITPKMADIKITNNNKVTSWGALYWQYFATLDKITPHETPLKLVKKLFIEKPCDRGPIIIPITENTVVKVGDKIKVRIELRVDRNMEYIHMKDMRASGFEPLNVLTQYKFQENLGYIESTRDASTDFFFAYLPKGEYVFEYPLRVFQSGNMSNGITNIQCMYAPEFTSHSEGVRVKIE